MADPVRFLDLDWGDWHVATAVVRRAVQLRNEQRAAELKAVVDAVGVAVGNQVARGLSEVFRAMRM